MTTNPLVKLNGRLVSVVDDNWRLETLPSEDVAVPMEELPDPDDDNGIQVVNSGLAY